MGKNSLQHPILRCKTFLFAARCRMRYRGYIKRLCKRHPDACVVLVFSGAIGDCCTAMSYLPAYRKKIGKEILLVASETLKSLLACFEGYDGVQYEPKRRIAEMGYLESAGHPWKWHQRHPDRFVFTDPWQYTGPHPEILLLKSVTALDFMRDVIYRLDADARMQVAKVPPAPLSCALAAGKKVIVNPFSNSLKIDLSVFPKLIEYFRAAGYAVYTNCVDETSFCFPNTERLVATIFELYSLVSQEDIFLSVRSGICDFLAPTGVRQIVIYDDRKDRTFASMRMWRVPHLLEASASDPHLAEKVRAFASEAEGNSHEEA